MKGAAVLAGCVVLALVAGLLVGGDEDGDSPSARQRERTWKSRLARVASVPRVRTAEVATTCRNQQTFVLPPGACVITIAPHRRSAVREMGLVLRQGMVTVEVQPAEPEDGETLLIDGALALRPGQPRYVQFGREGGRLTLRCAGTLCVVQFE